MKCWVVSRSLILAPSKRGVPCDCAHVDTFGDFNSVVHIGQVVQEGISSHREQATKMNKSFFDIERLYVFPRE